MSKEKTKGIESGVAMELARPGIGSGSSRAGALQVAEQLARMEDEDEDEPAAEPRGILVGVNFDGPVSLPGRAATSEFPPGHSGWKGLDGWSIEVVGDRLVITSEPIEEPPSLAAAEIEAHGLDRRQRHAVSIPLSRCTLRYAAVGEVESLRAPSPKLAEKLRDPRPPAPVGAAPATSTPAPSSPPAAAPPANPNAPKRRPPGFGGLKAPPPSEIAEEDR